MTKNQQKTLLKLARSAIEERLGIGGPIPDLPNDPLFKEKRGVFVTLEKGKGLRGCIGNIDALHPLRDGVFKNALAAAFFDPRFWPMTKEEWPEVHIEISVLTPPKPLDYENGADLLEKLRKKKPGVILKKGFCEATFLPQVWDQLSDPEVFLTHLCLKAGLAGTAWSTDKLDILTYEAEVFSEK